MAKLAGRSIGAVVLGSVAFTASISSCASEPPTQPEAGNAGLGNAGGGNASGGMSAGSAGLSSTGGTGGAAGGTGGTGAAGMSTGGTGAAGAATGGTSSGGISAGGSSGAGGAGAAGMAAGGSGGADNCTDDPPPNGTCADAVAFEWCGETWLNGACARTCGLCSGGGVGGAGGMGGSGGAGGGSGTGGAGGSSGYTGSGVEPPPDIQGGQNAWASRYWDCCKPACGWTGNTGGRTPTKSCDKSNNPLGDNDAKNACESGGSAFMCWKDTPWAVGDRLSYGFAAASGANYVCGRCFHIQFNGSSHNGGMGANTEALAGKSMIVQIINNGGVAADQFDLLIPGGGVGALNACSNQWGTSDLGAQYGGFLAGCNGDKNCVKQKCDTVFAGKPDLMEGCDWFLNWFNAADNPNFTYKQIACPQAIKDQSGLSD